MRNLLIFLLLLAPAVAFAQSSSGLPSPSLSPPYTVWTPSQWITFFSHEASKADGTNGVLTNPTISGLGITQCPATITSFAGCLALLPSGNGQLVLGAGITYVQTADVTVSTPNTAIICPGWNTIIQRGPSLTGGMLTISGSGSSVSGCTIDGNGITNTTNSSADLVINGPNAWAANNQVINSRKIGINLSGANTRATGNVVTGLASSSVQSYGIWAIGGNQVTIDHNVVTGTGIDGIGFDGNGTIVEGNQVSNDHCYTGTGGGQIASYNTATNYNEVIANNTIGTGCATVSIGLELNARNGTVSANQIFNQKWHGISVDSAAADISFVGNVSINNGQSQASSAALNINGGVSGMRVFGGQYKDVQGSPTQAYGINIQSGTGNNNSAIGADFLGNTSAAIVDGGSGLNKSFSGNLGIDDVIPSVASAATLSLPMNPVISLTGTTGVTAISGEAWVSRMITVLPVATVVFTAGATIADTFTTAAGVPFLMVYNGTKWSLR